MTESMRELPYTISIEPVGYSEGPILYWSNDLIRCELSAGTGDNITVRRIGPYIVVYSFNYHLDYAGLQVFDYQTGIEHEGIFLQGGALHEELGENWDAYQPTSNLRKLYRLWEQTQ